jgi:hypothetical protein
VYSSESGRLAVGNVLGELAIRLPGKANDDISGDCHARHAGTNAVERLGEVNWTVAAAHPFQHRRAATLKREVEVPAKTAVPPQSKQLIRQFLRLQGGDAEALDTRQLQGAPHKACQMRGTIAIRTRLRPGEHDFPVT